MAKFPQFEWMEIDGRMVPSIKPQHYKKGSTTETQLTGHDNPLPVANYVQNDSGVWLPTSKDNPVPTQLTGSNVEDENITNKIESIPAGESKYVRMTIPEGAMYFSLIIRTQTGSVASIRYTPLLGVARWSRYSKKMELINDIDYPTTPAFTKKEEIPSLNLEILIEANDDEDVTFRYDGNPNFGAHIFWWKG